MRHVLSILFGASFTLAACWATGKLLLSRWKPRLFAEELQLFRFATGLALFSLLTLIPTAANLAYTAVFAAAGVAAIAASFRVRNPDLVPLPDFPYLWKFLFGAIFVGFGVFYLATALAPEVSPDGSSYHLGLVARYFRQHGLGRITTSIYADLSQGLEMLFLVAFSFGRHSAAALIEFGCFLCLPVAIVLYSQRFGFPKVGVAAAAMVFCSPVFGISGSSAYNDAAATLILFCLFYALQIWEETREAWLIVVAGLLAGFCYGVKYSLFLAAPFGLAFVAWKLFRAKQSLMRPAIVYCACAGLLIAPWWIKNWITVGNPLAPFGNKVFANPYLTPRFESDYVKIQSSGVPAKDRFLDSTVRGGLSDGFLGPLFLLAPLGLFALRYPQGRRIVLAGAVFLIPALANVQTRFLMPAAPFWALAICLAVMRARGCLPAFALAAPLLALIPVADLYCDSWAWRIHDFPIRDAVRAVSERDSLANRLGGFGTVELINRFVPASGKVFAFGVPPEAYLQREDIVSYESALGETLGNTLFLAINPDYLPSWILTFPFPERRLLGVRVTQTAKGTDADDWSIGEMKVLRGGQALERGAAWKIHANANPWDIGYAFDGNPVTRWRSRTAMFSGMEVDVNFGSAQALDAVELDCSHDQWAIRLKLEGEDSPGHWISLSAAPVATERPVTANLRMAAIQQLKAHGITHMLLNQGDYVAADFRKDPDAWGVYLAGQAREDWLYGIK